MEDMELPHRSYLCFYLYYSKDFSKAKTYISSDFSWLLCKNTVRARTPSIHRSCRVKERVLKEENTGTKRNPAL